MATTLTYTTLDIVTEALRDAGVVGIDREADADEEAVGIKRLNKMLKAWQNSAITIWKQTTGSITVTDATQSYVIASRPLTLLTVNHKVSDRETWLYSMSRQEYFELPDKTTSGTPSQFYYHRERTQGTLYVWPVLATASGTIEWTGRAEVEDITLGSDLVDVPSELYETVHYNLAKRLLGAFPAINSENKDFINQMARESLETAEAADRPESIRFEPDYGAS